MRRWAIAQFPFGLGRREKHPVLRHVQAVYRDERLLTGQLRHGFDCVRDRETLEKRDESMWSQRRLDLLV
jgi:hypothetical protein